MSDKIVTVDASWIAPSLSLDSLDADLGSIDRFTREIACAALETAKRFGTPLAEQDAWDIAEEAVSQMLEEQGFDALVAAMKPRSFTITEVQRLPGRGIRIEFTGPGLPDFVPRA